MKKSTRCVVITPDGYFQESSNYPTLYLLHGYSGDYASWSQLAPQLGQRSDDMKMIIVCPDGGYRSWYIDSPIDSAFRYETFITKELIPSIDSIYKTKAESKFRAITGLSMGGHGGLFLGIRHTDLFGAAGSMSGGVDIRAFTSTWDLKEMILGDTICCKQNWEEFTVINVADQLKSGTLSLIIDCGIDDFFIDVNRKLHEKLMRMGIAHDYIERPGKHNSEYWRNSVDYQILYFKIFFESSTP